MKKELILVIAMMIFTVLLFVKIGSLEKQNSELSQKLVECESVKTITGITAVDTIYIQKIVEYFDTVRVIKYVKVKTENSKDLEKEISMNSKIKSRALVNSMLIPTDSLESEVLKNKTAKPKKPAKTAEFEAGKHKFKWSEDKLLVQFKSKGKWLNEPKANLAFNKYNIAINSLNKTELDVVLNYKPDVMAMASNIETNVR